MSVSDNVRMALDKAGISQVEMASLWGKSPQALYNKLNLERWSAADLVRVAEITGGRLAFIYPDGQEILIGTGEAARSDIPVEPAKPEKKKAAPKPKKEKKAKEPARKKPGGTAVIFQLGRQSSALL